MFFCTKVQESVKLFVAHQTEVANRFDERMITAGGTRQRISHSRIVNKTPFVKSGCAVLLEALDTNDVRIGTRED